MLPCFSDSGVCDAGRHDQSTVGECVRPIGVTSVTLSLVESPAPLESGGDNIQKINSTLSQ